MGWLWASSSGAADKQPDPATASSPAPSTAMPPPTAAPKSASNDAAVDPEIQKFMDLFKTESGSNQQRSDQTSTQASSGTQSSPPGSSPNASSSGPSSWFSTLRASSAGATTTSDQQHSQPAPIGDAVSESLLPTEMNCSQAFDLAWACNSLGGQWNAVYRYGEMRSCGELWNDFWFCMRTKSYTGDLKESMIKAHYRQKEFEKYGPGKPSSEDVWESRAEKVAEGSVFSQTFDAPAVDDDEWRNKEMKRRSQVRQDLGIEKPST